VLLDVVDDAGADAVAVLIADCCPASVDEWSLNIPLPVPVPVPLEDNVCPPTGNE